MSESFFSQLWYRVSGLKPALKPNVEIALHTYRGEPWYVLRDPMSGKVHRFTGDSYALIGAMTGGATIGDIWQASVDRLGEAAPSQDDMLRLLMQMHQSDLLLVDSVPMADELVERMGKQRRQKRSRYWKNPMAIPLPLFDPDRLLNVLAPLVRGNVGYVWLVLWLLLIGLAIVTVPAHWEALTATGLREILALGNLLILATVYPFVKLLHELAHGLAAKRHGGEIHEVGIMFLVFYPVPYVDASSSAAFPDKWARALVGAAGILAEVAIAAIALFVWLAAEPGLVRDAAFNAMIISGFSTLVVNGNPLLKFDGYYVLCDLLEIPNLAPRANAWWGRLIRKTVLNAPATNVRRDSTFEAALFAVYAPAAFVYRIVVMIGIALLVAGTYFVVGVLLAIWSVIQGLIIPAGKSLSHLFKDQKLIEKQGRAALAGVVGMAFLAAIFFLVPIPLRVVAEGSLAVPDDAVIRAAANGVLVELPLNSGSRINAQTLVARLQAPGLTARRDAQAARYEEARIIEMAQRVAERVDYLIAAERSRQAAAELAYYDDRLGNLAVFTKRSGTLFLSEGADMIGRHLTEGTVIGHVLPDATNSVKAVVEQSTAELLSSRLQGVQVKLVDAPRSVRAAEIDRSTPAATRQLPSAVLATDGGGPFALDPSDPEGLTAIDSIIQLDVTLAEPVTTDRFGTRAFVKLDFGNEPVAYRMGRAIRRVFLRHFGGQ